MRKLLLLLIPVILLTSCANSQWIDGEKVEPYGWADCHSVKRDDVMYKVNVGNIVWSVILCETIFVPIWLTGWQFYEPVSPKPIVKPKSEV